MTVAEALALIGRNIDRRSPGLRAALGVLETATRTARPVPAAVVEAARHLDDTAEADYQPGLATADDIDVICAYLLGRPHPETP
jgi:hypothetical protein